LPQLRGRKIEPLRGGSEAGHDLRLKDQGCADEYGHGSWTSQPSQIASKVCRGGGVVGTARYYVYDRAVTCGLYRVKPAQARGCTAWQVQILHAPANISCEILKIERSKTMSVNLIDTVESFGIPEDQEQRERFKIESKDQAIWALRKIAQAKANQDENTQAAQAEIDRIAVWRNEENEKLQRSVSFFESLLHEYFMQLREDDPKLKTVKLPHGSLKMRAQQPQYEYDEDQLLPWAKGNLPEAVVVKESIAKTPVKKHIRETGEMVPGVTITERPEKFSVEVV
jgi:hypothetical protein